jgi:hypothetical protein
MSAVRDTAWRCHARPAANGGKPCGHLNMPGESIACRLGNQCCAVCGCTRIAGTDRYKRSKPTQASMWIVKYQGRERDRNGPFRELQITVIVADGDEAYREAAHELGGDYLLGHPISAEPVVAP